MKITKSILKQLIKEELGTMSEQETDNMWTEIAQIMQKNGLSVHNAHAWLKDGLEKKYVQRKASPLDKWPG